MRILILGVSGMLGHALFAGLLDRGFDVFGASRSPVSCKAEWQPYLTTGLDALDITTVTKILDNVRPNVVVNAVGLVRQRPEGGDMRLCTIVNAWFPRQLFMLCQALSIRLVHYSTDCVFDGKKGSPYTEADLPTATDSYGISKFLGELSGDGALTIRTSIIGPEIMGRRSLLEWFLAQNGSVRGYSGAIFTGLPSSEQARVLAEYILPNEKLHGLYQVAAQPISKYELLRLIATVYGKDIEVIPDGGVRDDKRLSGEAFKRAVGYSPPKWPQLIAELRELHRHDKDNFQRYERILDVC